MNAATYRGIKCQMPDCRRVFEDLDSFKDHTKPGGEPCSGGRPT